MDYNSPVLQIPRVLQISSDKDDRRIFLGLKFDFGIFLGGGGGGGAQGGWKIMASIFLGSLI